MAGLSSVMAITRPLGEVNLAAMNRCAGVYRVYLTGGGGGGGDYWEPLGFYGGAGSSGVVTNESIRFVPPASLTAGAAGDRGFNGSAGSSGGVSSILDARSVSLSASGGTGGQSPTDRQSYTPAVASTQYVSNTGARFSVTISSLEPPPPYDILLLGKGGGSTEYGQTGGIIKAFRIG